MLFYTPFFWKKKLFSESKKGDIVDLRKTTKINTENVTKKKISQKQTPETKIEFFLWQHADRKKPNMFGKAILQTMRLNGIIQKLKCTNALIHLRLNWRQSEYVRRRRRRRRFGRHHWNTSMFLLRDYYPSKMQQPQHIGINCTKLNISMSERMKKKHAAAHIRFVCSVNGALIWISI